MITSRRLRIETSRGAIEYFDVGQGAPVLYFHGTGAGADSGLLLEQPLIDSGCRLIVPHRPGYYGTTLGVRGSAKFCAELMVELLDHLNIERAVVIGTSGGGMPSASFARHYPDRSAGLILQCAEAHRWDDGKWLPKGVAAALFFFRHAIFAPLLRWHNARHARSNHRRPLDCLKQMSGDRFAEIAADPKAVEQIAELTRMTLACAAKPAGIQNDWEIFVGENGVAAGTIECPTLIIHDPVDSVVPFRHAQWSHTCIPGSRLMRVHTGGHLIWFGRDFEQLHAERMAFIRQVVS